MKKLISILLVLALALSLLPMPAFAADNNRYFKRYTGKSTSVVDALKAVGADSSFNYRARIAKANGISDYVGSSQQNTRMLSLLKAGTLISPEASVNLPQTTSQPMPQPESVQPSLQPEPTQLTPSGSNTYFKRYAGDSTSIVDALKAVGADSSFNYRARIAKANGISDYVGSSQQNTRMLSLLKAGTLISPEASVNLPQATSQPMPQPESVQSSFQPESTQPTPSGSNTYFKRYAGDSTSIVDALRAVGVDSSFAYRSRIADANGIASYVGSSQQNTRMLSLLKEGILISPEASVKPSQAPIETVPQTKPTQTASQPETTQSTTQFEVVPTQSSYNYTCSDYSECTQDDAKIYVITKNNCAIRESPSIIGKTVAYGQKGQLISVKRVFRTWRFTKWVELQMSDSDKKLYIYTGNCDPHIHNYVILLENDAGKVEYCATCGYAKASTPERTATCDLTCIADQAIKGSFSKYNPSFSSVVAQIAVGEIPYVGWLADGRDVVGDIINSEPWHIIALDMTAFLPFAGIFKYADEIVILGKHTDDISKVTKYADEVSESLKYADRVVSVTTKTDSGKLANNMRKAFEKTGKERFYDLSDYVLEKRGVAAHHIVAGGASNKHARESRALLAYVGIDINDSANGVFLVSNSKYIDEGALHTGRHSETYFKTVRDRLFDAVENLRISSNADRNAVVAAYRQAVEKELDNIAEDLISGKLSLN